jgi:hypothetical protein
MGIAGGLLLFILVMIFVSIFMFCFNMRGKFRRAPAFKHRVPAPATSGKRGSQPRAYYDRDPENPSPTFQPAVTEGPVVQPAYEVQYAAHQRELQHLALQEEQLRQLQQYRNSEMHAVRCSHTPGNSQLLLLLASCFLPLGWLRYCPLPGGIICQRE